MTTHESSFSPVPFVERLISDQSSQRSILTEAIPNQRFPAIQQEIAQNEQRLYHSGWFLDGFVVGQTDTCLTLRKRGKDDQLTLDDITAIIHNKRLTYKTPDNKDDAEKNALLEAFGRHILGKYALGTDRPQDKYLAFLQYFVKHQKAEFYFQYMQSLLLPIEMHTSLVTSQAKQLGLHIPLFPETVRASSPMHEFLKYAGYERIHTNRMAVHKNVDIYERRNGSHHK
jgi:hypothetical protein